MAKIKEPSLFAKLLNSIVVNDLPTAAKYVLMKVVGPKAKEFINIVLKSLVDAMFGPGTVNPNVSAQNKVTSTSYTSYWSSGNKAVAKVSSYDVERPMMKDIWFPTEEKAQECYLYMVNLVKQQGYATVNQLFDKAELSVPHTADNWGWLDFTRARVVPGTSDAGESGWVLSTPRPIGIDKL